MVPGAVREALAATLNFPHPFARACSCRAEVEARMLEGMAPLAGESAL